jgi:hypothetical protein
VTAIVTTASARMMVFPTWIIVSSFPWDHDSRATVLRELDAMKKNPPRTSANTVLQNVAPLLPHVVRVVEGPVAHRAGHSGGVNFRHALGHDEGSTSAVALHHGDAALRFQDQLHRPPRPSQAVVRLRKPAPRGGARVCSKPRLVRHLTSAVPRRRCAEMAWPSTRGARAARRRMGTCRAPRWAAHRRDRWCSRSGRVYWPIANLHVETKCSVLNTFSTQAQGALRLTELKILRKVCKGLQIQHCRTLRLRGLRLARARFSAPSIVGPALGACTTTDLPRNLSLGRMPFRFLPTGLFQGQG